MLLKRIRKGYVTIFLLLMTLIMTLGGGQMFASAQGQFPHKAVITLLGVFSLNGAATEFSLGYGSSLVIPNATAKIDGTSVDVQIAVEFLGCNGWTTLELPSDNRIVIGDVTGSDFDRTAIYKVTYKAGEGETENQLIYTIYAGLEMFITTEKEITVFKNEQFILPKCLPVYKYREANETKYIDILATSTIEFFEEGAISGELVEVNTAAITPTRVGRYEITFYSPEEIKQNDEVYVSGSVSVKAVVNVREKRTNPIDGADGLYQTGYEIGGTSETGKGMVASSCAKAVRIEKRDNNYKLFFTITSADMMSDLKISQNSVSIEADTSSLFYLDAALSQTTSVVLTAERLEQSLQLAMYVIPMDREVSFSILIDLDNAYLLEEYKSSNNPITKGDGFFDTPLGISVIIAIPITILMAVLITILARKRKSEQN